MLTRPFPAAGTRVDRLITANGTVVGHSEFTHYQDVETQPPDLPAGDFTIDGYFIDFWWQKGDERHENPDPKPFGYDDIPTPIDESCGWVDDGEDDTPDPTYTLTDEPTEPDPGEEELEPEPTEELADGEAEEVGETEDSPEPLETESKPEKITEAMSDGAKDEMPPTGVSVALGILSATLVAAGAVALLRVQKSLSNA